MSAYPPHPRQTLVDRFVLNTVRDERGVRLRPLRGGRRRAAMRGWGRLHEYGPVQRAMVPRAVRGAMFGLTLALMLGAMVMVLAWVLPWIGGTAGDIGVMVAFGSLLLLIPVGLVHEHLDDRAALRAMLATRMCIRCAYDLEGAPEREPGVCVCPECGCVWRVRGAA